MTKELGFIHYISAIKVFRAWFAQGIISNEELSKIETIIADKYGLSSRSIYRQNA